MGFPVESNIPPVISPKKSLSSWIACSFQILLPTSLKSFYNNKLIEIFAAKVRPLNMYSVATCRSYFLCYNVPTFRFYAKNPMYVDRCTAKGTGGKTYTRYLLRESKRQGKKTIKTTILNITDWGEQTCEALRFVLGNKKRFAVDKLARV